MRVTLLKTAVALAVGLSIAGCKDSLAPTSDGESTVETAIVTANPPGPPGGIVRGPRYSGDWSGTLTIGPHEWTWHLEQDGNTVTGTVDPAPMAPGILTGTVNDGVLSVFIEYPETGAVNVGEVAFDRPPRTFSGDLVLIIPGLPFQIPFSTVMARGNSPLGGNAPATLSSTAAGAVPEGLASMYNVDGTLVNGPDSN